jgi:carbamate kinase
MVEKKRVVIALGGNAIIKNYQRGTVYEQFANTREALSDLPAIIREGHEVVITHGNGPQVGNILIRVEEALDEAYELPLGVCVAESQGEIGYMIAQTLKNFLIQNGIDREVSAVITQVIVDPDDPATFNPTKPIGPFLDEEGVASLKERKIPFVEDAGRGIRRVVPSPIPLKVVETPVIRLLLEAGVLVVAVGGGGMPVYRDHRDCLEGIDAVVDKDLASEVLAAELGADELIILTSVEKVALNFNKENEKLLDRLTTAEAKSYLDAGHFPPGSMGPKIEASIRFLEEHGGKRVVITSDSKLGEAFLGTAGTVITP